MKDETKVFQWLKEQNAPFEFNCKFYRHFNCIKSLLKWIKVNVI